MPKPFRELVDLFQRLEATSSRKEKIAELASFLKGFEDLLEASRAAQLLVGLHTGTRRRGLNIGPATLYRALQDMQKTLLQPAPLTITDVWETLEKVRRVSRQGSSEARKALIAGLFSRAEDVEREWLVKVVKGEMRHGVSHGLLLEALASLASTPLQRIINIDMMLGDLGLLVQKTLQNRLDEVGFKLFRPVKPMLADFAYSAEEVLQRLGRPVLCEPKIDGVRVQVHKRGGDVRVYSRGLRELTPAVPDVVIAVEENVRSESVVLDGEAYGVDEKGRPLPFQETMQRVGRERDVFKALAKAKLEVRFFDILFAGGEETWSKPLEERKKYLSKAVGEALLIPSQLTTSEREVERLLEAWMALGYEGLMAKKLRSVYSSGRRGGSWLKLKPSHTLDVVVVAAEWGHGRRRGWLSNYHLAVLDGEGGYAPVGKTFKGLTDDEFRWMTQELLKIKRAEHRWGVEVEPKIVVEVEYDEVQRSPHYSSGYALRFARVRRIRTDKQPSEADTLETVRQRHIRGRGIIPR